jgi:hypothetical protein
VAISQVKDYPSLRHSACWFTRCLVIFIMLIKKGESMLYIYVVLSRDSIQDLDIMVKDTKL